MLSIQQQGGILYIFFWEVYGSENIKKKDAELREMLKNSEEESKTDCDVYSQYLRQFAKI
jgi:hypothetical protein